MKLTVYAEYLFAENFMAGYGIIKLTGLLCGRKPTQVRMICGALMCGLFAFILLVNLSVLGEFALEVLFVMTLSFFVFRPDCGRNVVRIALVFYCVSFVVGGAAIAFIYASGCCGLVSNGIFYIGASAYILIACGACAGVVMILVIVEFVRKNTVRGCEILEMTIEFMGKTLKCRGKVDTGNYLKEPVSGKPVSVMEKHMAGSLFGIDETDAGIESRIRIVPYSSVGCESSVLTAIRCDSIIIDRGDVFGRGKIYLRNAFIGIYDGHFAKAEDEEEYSVLIQPELLSEGSMTK